MRESMGVANPTGAMKVKHALEVCEAGSRFPCRAGRTAGPSRCRPLVADGEEQERTYWYPKDGELCLSRMKPGETLVEVRRRF